MVDLHETETTEQGEQLLVSGVRPITLRDRLTVRAMQPMTPKRNPNAQQKPCDVGLFDEVSRTQTDMLDFIRVAELSATPSTQPNLTKET
ncbi:MAG: hypothetical protein L3J02_03955 [Henriciella sp.]|nr:hypothetical protein [Henriciella sp.]